MEFDYQTAEAMISKVKETIQDEDLSEENQGAAAELIAEAEGKIEKKSKREVIKAILIGLRDFLINVGANTTGSVIAAYLQQRF